MTPSELAAELSELSECQRAHVGAVLVRDGQVIGVGWNRGADCATSCLRGRSTAPVGAPYSAYPCTTQHAEMMALNGASGTLDESVMYVAVRNTPKGSGGACPECSRTLKNCYIRVERC